MNNDSIKQANNQAHQDLVGNFESGNFNVLQIDASYFDKKVSEQLTATKEQYESVEENAHLLEPFTLDSKGFIREGTRHCEDEDLNNKLLEEITLNAEIYKKLEEERKMKLEDNKRKSSPSLLSFLSSSNDDVLAKYNRKKQTKYISMFERNTQKVLDAQVRLSQALLLSKEHYSRFDSLLTEAGLDINQLDNDALKSAIQSNPQLAEACRMNMAAHKALLSELEFVDNEINQKNTLSVCDTEVANGFRDYAKQVALSQSAQLNINAQIISTLAPELDKSFAGNVMDEDDGLLSQLNAKELAKFVEEMKSIVQRFLSLGKEHQPGSNATPTM